MRRLSNRISELSNLKFQELFIECASLLVQFFKLVIKCEHLSVHICWEFIKSQIQFK